MSISDRTIRIGERTIGLGRSCFIIAEVGINHNGDLSLAKKLVDAARAAGVDAVKFQKRKLDEVYQQTILDHPRQAEQGVQYLVPILVEFELSDGDFRELSDYCRQVGILFMCTAFDRSSVDFLKGLRVPAYKIGSPDMTNFPLIEYVAATGKPLLLSTGMSSEEEIRRTVEFLRERAIACGLFHCVSSYPAPPDELNLRFMNTLREWSMMPVGYSGHETGLSVSLAAVAMGACMLERHLTLDKTMRGPDHSSSLEPKEFAELVRAVREIESAMGVPHRWLSRGEVLNRRTLSKSLVAAADIPAGRAITREMLGSKGPGLGLSPQHLDRLIGRRLERSVLKDDVFTERDLVDGGAVAPLRPVDVGLPWGIIARFSDLGGLIRRFADAGMSLVEFHISDRDLDAGLQGFDTRPYPYGLVIHAPEYMYDELIDLCSADERQRLQSVQRIQKTVDLARSLAPHFTGVDARGPKIVFHVGGMAQTAEGYDLDAAAGRLLDSLRRLDTGGVDLLLENLPPYPWYFGGRWCGFILTDAKTTRAVCEASGLGLCFDTSHAMLECNRSGSGITAFAESVLPFVRHVHLSDGAGISGEGLQIGEGQINFVELMPVLLNAQAGCVPEIWMGHHLEGAGFQLALERLTEIVWAVRTLAKGSTLAVRAELRSLVVKVSATMSDSLRAMEENTMGVVFIVDETGAMIGLATDGDVRRALLRGVDLRAPIAEVMNRDFMYALDTMDAAEIRKRVSAKYRVVPVLDSARRLVDFVSFIDPAR